MGRSYVAALPKSRLLSFAGEPVQDFSVLPGNIATETAFENAIILHAWVGGSANIVTHLLADTHEAKGASRWPRFCMSPCLFEVVPKADKYHIEGRTAVLTQNLSVLSPQCCALATGVQSLSTLQLEERRTDALSAVNWTLMQYPVSNARAN
jgi:hypothetical protein